MIEFSIHSHAPHIAFSPCLPLPQPVPERMRRTNHSVQMGKGQPSKKKPRSSRRLPPEKKARLEQIAKDFGVVPPKPGSQLDDKYARSSAEEGEPPNLYESLVSLLGVSTLESMEKALYVVLGGLLTSVIGGGLVISSEAFFKASGRAIPEGLDVFASSTEKLLSPALVAFLVLSSVLGIFKQSQLSSGVATYSESPEDSSKP